MVSFEFFIDIILLTAL